MPSVSQEFTSICTNLAYSSKKYRGSPYSSWRLFGTACVPLQLVIELLQTSFGLFRCFNPYVCYFFRRHGLVQKAELVSRVAQQNVCGSIRSYRATLVHVKL